MIAVNSARGHAKYNTRAGEQRLEKLQLDSDAADNEHDEYFGKYLFQVELAAVEENIRLENKK